jgi:hypothetical protein
MTAKKSRPTRNSQCKVCCLPADQGAILERLHCSGASDQSLADRWGMSRWAVARHVKHHLTKARRVELMAGPVKIGNLVDQATDESRSVLEMYQVTRSLLFSRMLAAAEAGDNFGTSRVGRVLIDLLDKLAKLTGELRQMAGISVTNNILNINADPSYPALEEGLLKLVHKHPAAREDVLALLASLEATSTMPGPNGARPLIECEAVGAGEIEMGADVS